MSNKWTNLGREGWYQNGPNLFEYLSDDPCRSLEDNRRPKAKIYLDMKYRWQAITLKWNGCHRLQEYHIGVFANDRLEDALSAIERRLSQPSMF